MLSLLAAGGSGVVWADAVPAPPTMVAKAAEVVDARSGAVLYTKNAHERLPIASVTKLMTLYIAVRAIQHKQLSLHDLVPVSEEAYRVNGSQVWLEPGERLSVDQLLKAVAVGSANDAAFALAEYIAGSPDAFVEDMNNTARTLGMTATHFANPHGLSQSGHYSTAHDMALLAQQAVKLPLLLRYTGMREDRTLRNGKGGTLWLINHNRLLGQFPGMDGLKTGYTQEAGFCIVATAKRVHTRMIAVVLGAPSSKSRFQDASNLLTWSFQHYETVRLADKGSVAGRVAVVRGSRPFIKAVFAKDSYITRNKNDKAVETRISLPASLQAPIRPGQILGYLVAKQDGREIDRIPVVAAFNVAQVTWARGVWNYLWKIAG